MQIPGLVRFEPATLSASTYPWVIKKGSKVEYVHDPLPNLKLLNAYVFKPSELPSFLQLRDWHGLAVALYPRHGMHHVNGFTVPTPVQVRRTMLEFGKAGWNRELNPDGTMIFWTYLHSQEDRERAVKLFDDGDFLPLIVFTDNAIPEGDVPRILMALKLAEPPYLTRFYPSESAITLLKQERLGLLFATFNTTYNNDEIVVYLPWQL